MATPTASDQNQGGGGQWIGLIRRRALVIITVATAFFGYSAWSALQQQTKYAGSFQILVEPVNADNASLADPTGQSQGAGGLDYPTQIAILKSPELLGEVAESLQPAYPGVSYGALSGGINVSRVGNTKMLQITYQSGNAAQTQAVLDALADSYLQYSLNERQTYLRQGLKFVEEQIDTQQQQVDQLQDQLEGFQEQNSFTDPATRSAQLLDQKVALEQKQQELEQQLVAVRAQMSTLQQDDGIQVALEQSSAYQGLLNQMQEIEAQIAVELTWFRPNNPAIQTLEKQRDNLLPLLQQQAEQFLDTRLAEGTIQTQALETQLSAIKTAQTRLTEQLQTIPALTRQYGNFEKELEITSNSLNAFLQTRQELQVEAAQQEIPWELVSAPGSYPINPDVGGDLMKGLFMGLALGVGAAFLLEKLDRTYHTADGLQRQIPLPLLGVLPFNQQLFLNQSLGGKGQRKKRKLLSQLRLWAIKTGAKISRSRSAIALSLLDEYDSSAEFLESLQVIHTNLQMSHPSEPVKFLAISSATLGDGKTTLALNLAQTAVTMGQRVLLVDAALRQPQLHEVLSLSNDIGLSSLLTENIGPTRGIQQVYPDEKLYVLTAGPVVENPASILASNKMNHLLSHYGEFFDLVIVDTPPVLGLADTSIISRYMDGLALVVRLDQTNQELLNQAIKSLQAYPTPVLGMVANGQKGYNPAFREAALSSSIPLDSR
ncbi:polysaccharide biosynthesis tyrosine autokinase [Leptothoe sp. LEGE 181152]|nr:polysaccharide biosynthesis tyrosine autokinase [Leptothoe sp. LEGE 181152]